MAKVGRHLPHCNVVIAYMASKYLLSWQYFHYSVFFASALTLSSSSQTSFQPSLSSYFIYSLFCPTQRDSQVPRMRDEYRKGCSFGNSKIYFLWRVPRFIGVWVQRRSIFGPLSTFAALFLLLSSSSPSSTTSSLPLCPGVFKSVTSSAGTLKLNNRRLISCLLTRQG